MESDRKRYYILVQDRVGYMIERSMLSFGAMKSTPTQLKRRVIGGSPTNHMHKQSNLTTQQE